jgi:hypothetical protein
MAARQPLLLADDLCEYSRNLLQNTIQDGKDGENAEPGDLGSNSAAGGTATNPQGGSGTNADNSGKASSKSRERSRKAALKAQQRQLVKKYSKVKQMTIDYYCREDLTVTTLKEFFEIFISSLKKEQAFHQELTSALYQHVGLSMKFDH